LKNNKISHRILLALFATLILGLFLPTMAVCQTEKLGIVQFTPPKGMTKTPKENVVAFTKFNQTVGKFCLITLYGATPGINNATDDFQREWNNLVVKNMKAEAIPKTDEQKSNGWMVISGGSEVETEAGKAVGFLTVISGFGKTISILAVFNDPEYVKEVDAFIGSLELDKATAPADDSTASPPGLDSNGNLIIPPPTRQITISDLVGEWGDNPGRISTTYVNRSDGSYAGTDSLAFTSKMTFTANGGYLNDFFAIRNGEKIIDKTVGTVTISGRVISIKHKGIAKYVIRGWLELPDMTILKVCGPCFDNQEIPERVFTDSEYGVNYNKNWIRKK